MDHDEYIVDFQSMETYVGTKPLSISYRGKTLPSHTWRGVYSSLCSYLVQDYPGVFRKMLDHSEDNKRAAQIIYDRFDANRLLAPYEIAPGCFIETNRSAYDFIRNIRFLLDACDVSYENVEIRYSIREKSRVLPNRSDCPDDLYSYVRSKAALSDLDPHLSLLYCMVQFIRENGYADCDLVLKRHNELTKQQLTRIPGSIEYKELFEKGFIYVVRVNAGTVSALKFQKPYSELLGEDNYQQLLEILLTANALRQSAAEGKTANKKQKTPLQKLIARINREIKQKTYVSDILIDEEEYELLKKELNKIIGSAKRSKRLEGSPLFAVGVVQVALRIYQDGNFWGPFYNEIGQPKGDGQEQRLIGTAFYKVLKEYGRFTVEQNRFVQNILLHCFVTNPYMDSYFSFLYAVYTSLLDRDLAQLDRDAMNALIERADRSNLLVKNTAEAFKANPRGAKIRIRNHLKLLDKLFWDPDYTLRTSNRIYSKLQLWARHSDKLILESASGRTSGVKGKKRFSKPYLFFDQLRFTFRLVFPQQIVIGDDPDLHWEISGQITQNIVPDIVEAVVGFKVQECSINLDFWHDLLGEFKIKLKDHGDNIIRSFSLPKTVVRFFDDEGYLIFTNQLHAGTTFAVTEKKSVLRSSSLAETHEYQGIVLSAFQFEDNDILMLPNGHAISIGGETIRSGLAGNAAVSGIRCVLQNNTVVPLMSKFPHIILRMAEVKAPGTCIEINTKRFSLADVAKMSFPIDDRSGDTGYWIEMDKVFAAQNGVYSVLADIPGGSTFKWDFVYIDKFEMTFEESPYVFEPRGVVRFRDNIMIRSLEKGCQKDVCGNAFRFELAKVGRSIDFTYEQADFSCILSADVPALFTSFTGEDWSAERPDAIWHSELPDIIYISAPQQKFTLFAEDPSDDLSSDIREKEYRKSAGDPCVACDIRWFKSYLDTGNNISILDIKLDAGPTELLRVVRHSIAASCSLFQVDEGHAIRVHASIIGKGTYYADVSREGVILAEKIPLENESCTLNMLVENGQYIVELFEGEEDDSGFGDADYYSIGKFYSDVVNPYDMSHRSFQILYVEKHADAHKILDLSFDYYVEDLVRTKEKDMYSGMMVVETGNKQLAAFPVFVLFFDMSDPSLVSISYKDEYNDPMSFLYDTKRKGILKEENPKLPKLTCYRRYTFLDLDEDLYRIEFIERDCSDYRRICYDLVFEESTYDFAFRTSVTKIANRKPDARDVTWSKAAYPYVLQTHVGNIAEFSKWTKEEIKTRYHMPDVIIDSIETTLAFYGVYFRRKEIVTQKGKAPDSKKDEKTVTAATKEAVAHTDVPTPITIARTGTNAAVEVKVKERKPAVPGPGSISSLNLQKMTFNCLAQAGITKIEQLLALYEKKGVKGFGNIPRFHSEMQQELVQALRREKLI